MSSATQSLVEGFPVYRGKVRDVYDLGNRVLLVATDRISAFDYILPNLVPDKGRILTGITAFWMQYLKNQMGLEHGLISTALDDCPEPFRNPTFDLAGRVCLMQKLPVIQVECVARGYLAGSGLKEYQATGNICGNPLPLGLQLADRLPQILFTPATKASTGHDENIPMDQVVKVVGEKVANSLKAVTLSIFTQASLFAESKGLILADTKFEFGLADNRLVLVDEVLTPDSSRFWEGSTWRPGLNPPSFDKQFVRDWLEMSGWDKNSPPPNLPESIITKTRNRYVEAFERLTGQYFPNRVSSWGF